MTGSPRPVITNPDAARRLARDARSWDLAPRQLCGLELLLNGAFSLLGGFMGPADYDSVLRNMRLAGDGLWPIPVTLDVSESFAEGMEPGEAVALGDGQGLPVAIPETSQTWRPEKTEEARTVYGTADTAHPGAFHLLHRTHPVYLGGRVWGIEPVLHHDHRALRHTPAQLRERFRTLGWRRVVAFQTRNPLHRAHIELTLKAARAPAANLRLHPAVGETQPGDVDRFTRIRCYERVLPYYAEAPPY